MTRQQNRPRNRRELFLHDLYNDPRFVSARDECLAELSKYDVGISSLVGESIGGKAGAVIDKYSEQLSQVFGLDEAIMEKGLLDNKYIQAWRRKRSIGASIDGNRISITIGAETRVDELKKLWNIIIAPLQNELDSQRTRKAGYSDEPSLEFIIHKGVINKLPIKEIYDDYIDGKLEVHYKGKIPDYSDVAKDYRKTVKGLKKVL